ncbi:hypothetical protein CK203_046156 [Vitis vinifera]|uniref:DUF659 domain-containing protein n=1 Tax=Vitis vinifera TaxID=29760 RepID=A0A438I4D2_VITVI|nr:hypothetical protein CK203_046156 [Vitis vinifera]
MFMQSVDASSMIKTGEKMFELLDKWVEQVSEENVIQVITDNHSSYVMADQEDGEGYKCGDGNDDDDDFVDLEEE